MLPGPVVYEVVPNEVSGIMALSVPVSYTHLDVYKRQVCSRFFSTVKNCDSLGSLRYSSQEMFSRERTV